MPNGFRRPSHVCLANNARKTHALKPVRRSSTLGINRGRRAPLSAGAMGFRWRRPALVLETGAGGNGWDEPVRRRRERGLILWKWQGDCAVDRV
jgi:hypothetical protein